jgi:hypothetical protein
VAAWMPEGGWLPVLFAATGCAAAIGAIAVALAGRPGGRLATGVMLGYLAVCGAAAAARIALAVDRGRDDLDVGAIVVAFGLAAAAAVAIAPGVVRASASPTKRIAGGAVLTVVAVGMLVAAVSANLEAPT